MLFVLLQFIFSDDQIKDEFGGACSAQGGRREIHTGFWW